MEKVRGKGTETETGKATRKREINRSNDSEREKEL